MKKVLLIHGPNLNLTGQREPGIYGSNTLASINAEVVQKCERLGMECAVFQSNSEGALIDRIHAAREDCDAIIMNAGAYTHYSYAIHDALKAVSIPAIAAVRLPCVEVHMSNVHAREEFRHKSVIGPVCAGVIAGFGKHSYLLAVDAVKSIIG